MMSEPGNHEDHDYLIPLKDTDTQTWTTNVSQFPDSTPGTSIWTIQAPSWDIIREL